jgi:hypothetical protein
MKPPLEWLNQQVKIMERELEEARVRLEEAERRVEKAKVRLNALEVVLDLAQHQTRPTRKGPLVGLVEEALKIHPMSNRELQTYLSQQGRVTTANSINTSLNRSNRFVKGQDKKWNLTPHLLS